MIEHAVKLPAGTIKRIHVDQKRIRKNTKQGTDLAAITVQTSKGPIKCHEVAIDGPSKMVYRPHDPLSCGARLWIETKGAVETSVR